MNQAWSSSLQIYRRTFGEHVGFKMFMDAMLLSITRKVCTGIFMQFDCGCFPSELVQLSLSLFCFQLQVVLPDMEFFLNLGDWPLEHRGLKDNPLPIFSWCGSEETRDQILPTYDVTESTLETMGRYTRKCICAILPFVIACCLCCVNAKLPFQSQFGPLGRSSQHWTQVGE